MKNNLYILFSILFFFSTSKCFAATKPLLGLNIGHVFSNSKNTVIEGDKDGFNYGFLVGVKHNIKEKYMLMGDFSWQYFKLSGTPAITSNPKGTDQGKIKTKSLHSSLSFSKKLSSKFFIGPLVTYSFSNKSFSPYMNESEHPLFLGIIGMFEISKKFDIGLFSQISVNSNERNIYYSGVKISFSFGPKAKKEKKLSKTIVKALEKKEPIVWDSNLVNFDFESATILEESKEFLKEIAQILIDNEKKIIALHIYGHTDKNGPDSYNLWLSRQRAQNVKAFIVEQGFPFMKVTFSGHGANKLIDSGYTSKAHKKNRRVEIKFISTNESKIKEKILFVIKKYTLK